MTSLLPSWPSSHAGDAAPSLRPLRIAHVVSSLNVGGMEQFVVRLAAHQRRQGEQVSIVTLHDGPLHARADESGVPAQILNAPHKFGRLAQGAWHFRRLRPDIIHAHNTTSLHFAALGARVSGARLLITCHGRGKGTPRRLGEWERDRTRAAVAVSHAVRDEVEREFAGRVVVIHNGIDGTLPTRPRAQVRAELGLREGQPTAIVVARMDALKGHATLLRALALLRETGSRLTTLFVGDGDERPDLERLARESGLDAAHIRFLGFRQDVTDLLAASDLFVLPSLSEGLPLSILEAMSQGLPIVASNVGGIPELVENGRQGVLVPPGDARILADALQKLACDADLRQTMGAAGQARVTASFGFDRMAAQYAALYHSLLAA